MLAPSLVTNGPSNSHCARGNDFPSWVKCRGCEILQKSIWIKSDWLTCEKVENINLKEVKLQTKNAQIFLLTILDTLKKDQGIFLSLLCIK